VNATAALTAALLTLGAGPLAAQPATPPVAPAPRIAADPRIELLAIVFRLAGASEFSQNQYAEYDADVVRQFGAFRGHEAVTLARDLHDKRDVGSLVRAAVGRFLAAHGTPEEQRTYPTLAAFMPRVVAYYDSLPERVPELKRRYDAARPHVVSVSVPNGEGAVVAPGVREVVVRFDRPVRDHRFGVVPLFVGGRPASSEVPPPPVTGHALDSAGTTLRIAVALAPGRAYAFQLNTPNGFGFRTPEGVPLAAYPIRFRTGRE